MKMRIEYLREYGVCNEEEARHVKRGPHYA